MTAAFLLDTSFLITLADDSRPGHAIARQYYEHALQEGAPLHVSTLALAEFATKQAVTDLPLRTFRIEPFNIRHAIKSGELCAGLMPTRDAGDNRAVVRTDLQLIAQAASEGIPFILTEDRNTLSKYVERARSAGSCQCRAILLSDGFDEAWFNDGQKVLKLSAQDTDASET
ncbi:MAG: PIN domain-containing protein [Nevskia sp.]|jgi:predicted nucleic acid-binding protein|nr:PIN domain-containing protein [Nevskia sp.]MCK9384957.1 PIN domain-containing protein [Nevskia sp.]